MGFTLGHQSGTRLMPVVVSMKMRRPKRARIVSGAAGTVVELGKHLGLKIGTMSMRQIQARQYQ
jgi:hypothetical protein